MSASVYLWDLRATRKAPYDIRLKRLGKSVGLNTCYGPGQFVALKVHFGEQGTTGFLSPLWLRPLAQQVLKAGGRAFFTDTNTLYRGQRGEAVSHALLAANHGFDPNVLGAPVIIADGLRSNNEVSVKCSGRQIQTAYLAGDIVNSDFMLVLSHFKGHDLAGFGGALKNLAMGCATRRGKLQQHSGLAPIVKKQLCTGCGRCLEVCPTGALHLESKTVDCDPGDCIGCAACLLACPSGALAIDWKTQAKDFLARMAEYALAVSQQFKQDLVYLNFIRSVTPGCDCIGYSDAPICPDLGVLASRDPVAIDQASLDLVNQATPLYPSTLPKDYRSGQDKFKAVHPETKGEFILEYAEEIGLGSRDYRLITVH
jgi:hypothetical protein